MKKVLIFSALFLLAAVSLSAQVVKGAGLWYFNGLPNVTPSVATGTEVAYSINNKALFKWNRTTSTWVSVVQDSSITNELQDLILSGDTLSLTLSDSIILMGQYRNRIWEITNLSDTTSITTEIEGDVAYTSTGDTIAFRSATAWLPFTGGGGGGTFNSFNIAGDTGSSIVTDGQTVTVAGGYGINTAETGGTVTVTADTTQLVTPSDIAGLMTNWLLGGTSGTPQTVSSGQTATVAAGTGITTTAGATRTVTVAIANTGVSAATYGSASQVPVFAVNAQGQLTTATNTAIQIAISQVTGLSDSLSSHPSGTGTNLRIPLWTGSASLGSSTLLQSATGQTLDANLAFRITGGTTASRPTGAAGMMYYNTSNNWFDMYGTTWENPLKSGTVTGLGTAGRVFYADAAGRAVANDNLSWDASGDFFGIGTTSPLITLHMVSGSTGFGFGPANIGALVGANFIVANNILTSVTGKSLFLTAENTIFRTTSSAGVGIGTINFEFTPAARLELRGRGSTSATQNALFRNSAGSPIFSIRDDGRVAIGNEAPANLFDVEGSAAVGASYAGTTAAPANGLIVQGNVGVGTNAPDQNLHSELSGSATNSVGLPLRLSHITSGTATAGFGVGWELEAENASGTNRVIGQEEAVYTTATNAAEVSDLVFRTMRAGTLTESLRSLGNGTLQVGTLSGTATQWLGATAGNILTTITPGYGLTLASGSVRVDTTALKGQYLPLNLTGTTTVNTNGQQLWIRDSGGYPYTFMNSNYWIAVSDINTYMDVGSTSGTVTGNSATRMYLASAGTWEAQAASELRLDADSILIDATLPLNTNATHVLVRDAVTQRVEEFPIGSTGTWLKPELEAGDVNIAAGGNELTLTDGAGGQLTLAVLNTKVEDSDGSITINRTSIAHNETDLSNLSISSTYTIDIQGGEGVSIGSTVSDIILNSASDVDVTSADEIRFNGETQQYNIVSHSAAPSVAITNAGSGATITGYSTENSSVSGRFTFTTGTGAMAGGNTVQLTFTGITFPQVPIVQIQGDATKDTNGGLAAAVLIGSGKCVPIATTTNFTLYIDATGLANSTRYDFTYTVSSAN